MEYITPITNYIASPPHKESAPATTGACRSSSLVSGSVEFVDASHADPDELVAPHPFSLRLVHFFYRGPRSGCSLIVASSLVFYSRGRGIC